MQSALHQIIEIDRTFPRSRWTREVHKILDNVGGASRLLLQHHQLLASALWLFTFLQKFGHAHNASQRIVQLMRETADHLSHGCQPLALNDLLFKLFLHCDIANGHDYPAGFSFGVEQWAGIGAHGTPAPVAVPHSKLAETELLCAGAHVVVESKKLGRLTLLRVVHFLPQHVRGGKAEQVPYA